MGKYDELSWETERSWRFKCFAWLLLMLSISLIKFFFVLRRARRLHTIDTMHRQHYSSASSYRVCHQLHIHIIKVFSEFSRLSETFLEGYEWGVMKCWNGKKIIYYFQEDFLGFLIKLLGMDEWIESKIMKFWTFWIFLLSFEIFVKNS